MSWCMSTEGSKKTEAGLLLLLKAHAMHVNVVLVEDRGWVAAPVLLEQADEAMYVNDGLEEGRGVAAAP